MEEPIQEYERYQQAKKRVDKIKGFYGNLFFYIVVNLFLLFINLKYSPEELWFYWPMLGWGIGVLFHGMSAFNYTPFLGKDWEQRKIKELMDQDNQQHHG